MNEHYSKMIWTDFYKRCDGLELLDIFYRSDPRLPEKYAQPPTDYESHWIELDIFDGYYQPNEQQQAVEWSINAAEAYIPLGVYGLNWDPKGHVPYPDGSAIVLLKNHSEWLRFIWQYSKAGIYLWTLDKSVEYWIIGAEQGIVLFKVIMLSQAEQEDLKNQRYKELLEHALAKETFKPRSALKMNNYNPFKKTQ